MTTPAIPPDGRRYGALTDAQRQERPTVIRPSMFPGDATPADSRDARFLVPIESVRSGDQQVLAARGPRPADRVIDLDALVDYPTVTSVVATTSVRARRPLPHMSELLLFGEAVMPDAETLGNLPALERAWLTLARGTLETDVLPRNLRALGVGRHHLPSSGGDPLAALSRFSELRRLKLWGCLPKDSVEAIAPLVHLVELRADAPLGWARLRTCTALENVSAIRPRMANLRPLRAWTNLRRLTITGSGLKSLAGIEAFTALEQLRLVMVAIDDLSPVQHLPHLAEVDLTGVDRVRTLDAFGSLPALRSLSVQRAGADYEDIVHVATLQPLKSVRTLEELVLQGAFVDDGSLAVLADLPALRHVVVCGDLGDAVSSLRHARPDVDVTWDPGPRMPPGERVGTVLVRPPVDQSLNWWIREDLTARFGVRTNAGAERRLRRVIQGTDPELLRRLNFDTEADAVSITASEADIRATAEVITRIADREH